MTPPSAAEAERVLAAIDPERCIATLRDLIAQNSYSGSAGEIALARRLAALGAERGLEVETVPVAGERVDVLWRLSGSAPGPRLMLNGHIDTNPAGEGWTVDPFGGVVRDGFVFGIGASNMKAADAATIEALTAVHSLDLPLAGSATVALVVGELQGGIGTKALVARGEVPDLFIVGEPTDLGLLTLHAGSYEFQVNVVGETRHMSKMEEAYSAIDGMMLVIDTLKHLAFDDIVDPVHAGLVRFNVGVMRAGMTREYLEWRVPQVPDFCTIKVAGRHPPSQTREAALAGIDRALADLKRRHPRLVYELRPTPAEIKAPMPPFEIAGDDPFVALVAACHARATGGPPRTGALAPYKFYGTDAGHLAAARARGVVYGPGGLYNTMPDERVAVADIVAAARTYALVIAAVCAPRGAGERS